jgi:hypothetical protein
MLDIALLPASLSKLSQFRPAGPKLTFRPRL